MIYSDHSPQIPTSRIYSKRFIPEFQVDRSGVDSMRHHVVTYTHLLLCSECR